MSQFEFGMTDYLDSYEMRVELELACQSCRGTWLALRVGFAARGMSQRESKHRDNTMKTKQADLQHHNGLGPA